MSALRRGTVVRSQTLPGAVLWVVVSADQRNSALNTVLVARISPLKSLAPTAVPLGQDDPYTGAVLVDFITTEKAADLSPAGMLTAETMHAVSIALRLALP